MPKITVHGGPSDVTAVEVQVDGAWLDVTEHVREEGGEQPSPGSSSSPSDEKPPPSGETNEVDHPRRARTTASRSSKAQTARSTARSTAGRTRKTT